MSFASVLLAGCATSGGLVQGTGYELVPPFPKNVARLISKEAPTQARVILSNNRSCRAHKGCKKPETVR